MSHFYPFLKGLSLHVRGRISSEDANRQESTAKEILKRLADQPGVVLADEVGMGKTFVALAVAVSVALNNRGRKPVVVMVPPTLKEKWPADFELFREKCLPKEHRDQVRCGVADRAEDFLKLIDDPPERRRAVIFLTHGAMSRGLGDRWVMLALIYQALLRRRNVEEHRRDLSKVLGELLRMRWVEKKGKDIWIDLLRAHPSKWLDVLRKWEIDPEGDGDNGTDDDPVPEAIVGLLPKMPASNVNAVLRDIPKRRSESWDDRLSQARTNIKAELRGLWKECLHDIRLRLPLLILDEAHHLKNSKTQLASLFQVADAREDMEEIARGPLGGAFERMLFLTATPFQLGHGELCSVLDRFRSVAWKGAHVPAEGQDVYEAKLKKLREALDDAQVAGNSLDIAWGRLEADDLVANGRQLPNVEDWWKYAEHGAQLTPRGQVAVECYRRTHGKMKAAEKLLRPWVVRHLKSKQLPPPSEGQPRRVKRPGASVLPGRYGDDSFGIPVDGEALLPFLLAARACAQNPESRPVFSEGLASSYEAFLETRRVNRRRGGGEVGAGTDEDDDSGVSVVTADEALWYLDQLEKVIPKDNSRVSASHPKIKGTLARVKEIWGRGEKVVVFCHYIATGRILRQRISEAIEEEIVCLGAAKLKCAPDEVMEQLEHIGKRFFDEDSPIRLACDREIGDVLDSFAGLRGEDRPKLIEAVRRNLRTPSSLVRYFPLREGRLTEAQILSLFRSEGDDGLRRLLGVFFSFLIDRCGDKDRGRYIDAVESVQTGRLRVEGAYSSDEAQGDDTQKLLANVRLVNGATKQETRQRLMLTFNTPFYPEVLVASSVMAEGVDLHLNCRHVIHHDLCWNPSTLEQRTGRVDRIGARAEHVGKPIEIYLPYVAETQDEKMYRVVMDRERWFNVVMGGSYSPDYQTTERLAARIAFPEAAAETLKFRLEV